MSHDRINCEDKPVKVCFNETDKKGDKICRNVTQTVCDVQKGTKIDKFPETEVITMNNQSSKYRVRKRKWENVLKCNLSIVIISFWQLFGTIN